MSKGPSERFIALTRRPNDRGATLPFSPTPKKDGDVVISTRRAA